MSLSRHGWLDAFFQARFQVSIFSCFPTSFVFSCPKGAQNGPQEVPRGNPKIINFSTLDRQGAQNGPRWASRAPKGCPTGLQGSKMRSKMTSQGLQKEKVFANLTDLQHLKNAGIPSSFFTVWRLRSGGRVHHTLSAADWEFEN